MLPLPVTSLPGDVEAMTNSVNLGEHRGKVVEITTTSGSIYWVVPLAASRRFKHEGAIFIYGLSITTTSETVGRFTVNPWEVQAANTVRVGEPWRFGDKGSTSNVRSVRVL